MANTRPASPLPTFATDATYTSGPDNTLATKVQPTSGELSQGYSRTGRVPARKVNWLLNKLGAWIQWLSLNALDGENGGNWAPSAPINVGGAGVTTSGPLVATSTANFQTVITNVAGLLLGGSGSALGTGSPGLLITTGGANVTGDSRIAGNFHVTAGSTVDGASSFGQQVTVSLGGIVTGSGFTAIGNGLDGIIVQAGGFIQLAGQHTVIPPSSFQDEIVLDGIGRIRERLAYAPDADHTFAATDGTVIIGKSGGGGITAPRVWQLGDGVPGTKIKLVNYSASNITLHNSSGGVLLYVPSSQLPAASGASPGALTLIWLDNGTYTGWSAT